VEDDEVKHMKKFAISTLLAMQLIAPNMSFAQSNKDYSGSYLCITDVAGGIWWNATTQSWQGTNFRVGNRYILTLTPDGLSSDPQWHYAGMTYIVTWAPHGVKVEGWQVSCNTISPQISPRASVILSDFLFCENAFNELQVSFGNMKFQRSTMGGYTDHFEDRKDPSYVEAGSCTKIN